MLFRSVLPDPFVAAFAAFFAAVFRGRAGEDARVAMPLTLSTMATTRPEVKRGVTGLVVVARNSTAL